MQQNQEKEGEEKVGKSKKVSRIRYSRKQGKKKLKAEKEYEEVDDTLEELRTPSISLLKIIGIDHIQPRRRISYRIKKIQK